ncbi:putative DBH-like monooxygenase protein 2 [Tachyglossus aculeatus]|uniref:putative DBH-like monooxygenase protein 2 n=1 Tax=Tachyglossus aculeatus TaxID=9261 RepID=UPI0018F4598C|nr:putative DBH-like monooxygenase protein 2 [Tachyglossus aculeatus]
MALPAAAWPLLLLPLFSVPSWGGHIGPKSPLRYSRFLDPSNIMYLRWDFDPDAEVITFDLQVRTAGWVGLGITTYYTNVGADLVVGGVLPNGSIYFSDQHLLDDVTVEPDGSQDAHLQSLVQDSVYTTMRFSRPFRSCDPHDRDITEDTIRVIGAYGLSDQSGQVKLEAERTFVKSIFLLQVIHPDQLDSPDTSYIYDIGIKDFLIPEDDTTYACSFLPLPIVKEKHHIYKFEPRLTYHNETMVHHILVYACGNASVLPKGVNNCYGSDPAFSLCSQVIIGWAVGGTSYQFPDDVGISIGTPIDPKWVRLEIHYSNVHGLPGIYDSSGMRVFFTPILRKYDMGVLQLGVYTFPIHFLPPGATSFHSYGLCQTDTFEEVTGSPLQDLHVYGYLLHTHLTGRSLQAVQYRNGVQLRTICKDNAYDFNLQETRDLKDRVEIKLGDELLVECVYQTLDRDSMTFGGPSTMNEMCLIFLFYFPRNTISSCMGYPGLIQVAREFGEEVSDVMEGLMVMSGVDWTEENIRKAERACQEADQVVIIKTIDEMVTNRTGHIPAIAAPVRGSCVESSGGKVEAQDQIPAGFRAAPSSSGPASAGRLPAPLLPALLLLLLQGVALRLLDASPPRT